MTRFPPSSEDKKKQAQWVYQWDSGGDRTGHCLCWQTRAQENRVTLRAGPKWPGFDLSLRPTFLPHCKSFIWTDQLFYGTLPLRKYTFPIYFISTSVQASHWLWNPAKHQEQESLKQLSPRYLSPILFFALLAFTALKSHSFRHALISVFTYTHDITKCVNYQAGH